MTNLSTVIESINQQVDGQALVRLTDYHVDKVQLSPTTLKCFCPVHQELAFRSLILNLKAHTYKCMMRRCQCFEGGSFVEFWGILTGKEPIEAALDLADRLKIAIDKGALTQLGAGYAEQAGICLDERRVPEARASIDEALAVDPKNAEWRLLSARIWEAGGMSDRALLDQLSVLDGWMGERRFNVAREMLVRLLDQHPENPDLLDRQVRLSREEGEKRELATALLRRADLLERKNENEEALKALCEARDLKPDDPSLLQRIAVLCLGLGRHAEYADALVRMTRLYEELGETPRLLEILAKRIERDPEDLDLRRRRARILREEGLADQARAEMLGIVERRVEAGKHDEAIALVEELLLLDSEDVDLLERQARLFNLAGRKGDAVAFYRQLAALAQKVGLNDRVGGYFELARAIDPLCHELRREQAEWKLACGDPDGGINDLFALATHDLEYGAVEEGKAVLERISDLAPADIDKRIRVGRCLERAGLETDAFESYVVLARSLGEQKRWDAAQAICEEVRRLRPMDPATLELRIETHLALKQRVEAIEACREVAREHLNAGDAKGAEDALLRAIRIDRSETRAKTDLSLLYEETGRPEAALQLWIEMALFHRAQQQPVEAYAAVREALRLDPANREARVLMAEGLEAAGKAAQALEIWTGLGRERMAESDEDDQAFPQALEWLSHALEIAPRDAELLADVAPLTLAVLGAGEARPVFVQWLEALAALPSGATTIEAYRLAVGNYPAETPWRVRLASLLLEAGLNEGAADQFEALLRGMGPGADNGQRHAILEKLSKLRPDSPEMKVELARSCLAMGRTADAVDLFYELARVHLDKKSPESALALYEEALGAAPDHAGLLNSVAVLCEELGYSERALARYDRLAEINRRSTDCTANIPVLEKLLNYRTDDATIRAELAEIYEKDGDIDKAVEHAYALARRSQGRPAEAESMVGVCMRIRSMAPDFIPARELLVEGFLTRKDTARAKQELDTLGDLALVSGKVEAAESYFKRIREIDPDDIGSSERLGKIYEAAGKIEEAAEAFEHVLGVYERMSETARAIGVLQKLKQIHPADLEVRRRLARALLETRKEKREAGEEWLGLIELAVQQKQTALLNSVLQEAQPAFRQDWPWRTRLARLLGGAKSVERSLEAWRGLAQDALEARAYEVAREAAGEGLSLASNRADLRELRIEANRRLSSYESAAEDLRFLAEGAAADGRFAPAIDYLRQALELKPRAIDLMEMLAEAQLAAGVPEDARQTLRALAEIQRAEGDLELAVGRARRIVEFCDDDEGRDYLATLLEEAGRKDEAIAIWRELADRCAKANILDAALFRYARILEMLPGDIDILRRIADLSYENAGMLAAMAHYDRLIDALVAEGNPETVIAEFMRILDMEPGHLALKERLAEYHASQGAVDRAREHLLEIVIAYRDERDQADDALRVLRRLQTLDPDNIEALEQEAVMLENMDRRDGAAAVWRKIAQAHRTAGDVSEAAGCLVHCAELESENPRAQIDAAETFAAIDDRERATDYFLRAIDIYDRQENIKPCVEILERAIAINPGRDDLADALARIFERLGMIDRAVRQWLDLGARFEAHRAPAEATRVYVHLRSLAPADMECRSRLAAICEAEGDRHGALAELRELARLAGSHGDADAEASYLSRVLDLEPGDEEAMQALAEVLNRLGRTDDRFDLLARIERNYCSAGKLAEALSTLDELKALRPDDPDLMMRSIELLIKTGRADVAAQQGIDLIQVHFDRKDDQRALEMLSRIAEIDPNNIERRISLARLVHANGRDQAAFQEFFLLASRLFGEERYEESLSVCNAGIQSFMEDVKLRDLMGRALLKLGRGDEAIEVQLHLAAIHDERGEESKAQRVYESILEEQPDHQGTLEAMIDWSMRHERFPLAVDHLVRLAESHYLAGALDKAIDAMERTQTIDPTRLDLKARLAEIYLETGDEQGACTTWLAAARGMMNAQDYDDAVALFEKTFALRPDDSEILEALVEAYASAGRTEEHLSCASRLADSLADAGEAGRARATLESLTRRYPDDPRAWERLVAMYREAGEFEPAVEACRRLCAIHRAARRLNEARECLETAIELAPDRVDLLEELGDLLLSLGRRPDGVALLAKAAQALAGRDEHEKARDLCRRVLKLEPHSLEPRRLLAASLERLGDLKEALEEYRQAARDSAEAHDHGVALEILQRLLALDPSRVEERELFAKLLRREGRIEESIRQTLMLLETIGENDDPRRAIKYCRQILDENADHPQAHMHLCAIYERTEKWRQAFQECEWLADYYQSKGALNEAEASIRKALGWLPEELGMRTRLVELLIKQNRMDQAAAELAEVARQSEARADLRMSRWAMIKACEIKPDDLDQHRQLADFLERQGELADARSARMKLIRLLLAAGEMEEARDLAERVVDATIEDDALRIEIAELFDHAGVPEVAAFHHHHIACRALAAEEFEKAKLHSRQTIALKPRHVGARETLISALLAQRDNNQALKIYEEIYELYDEASEWDGALRALQSMIDLVPSRPEPRRKLITLYRKMRREEPMIDQLRRLVEIYVNSGQHEEAVECLRDLMTIRPEDTRSRVRYIDLYTQIGDERELRDDYLQLARILGRKGSVVEAMRTYEKLLQLHPDEPVCREEFIQFLFEQGQVSRGVEESRVLASLYESLGDSRETGRVLERALNYAPDELDMRQSLAGILLKTNRRGLALEAFRSLARCYDQAGDQKRLIEVIEQIVQIDSLNVEYRQRLAELYFRNKMIDQAVEQSIALADQYAERELFDLAEQELRRVLAVRPQNIALWQRLIEVHLKIGQPADVLPDMHNLAALLKEKGKLKDAIGVYKQIIACDPENIQVLQKYIDIYMEIGMEQDLIDDYLKLADLKMRAGDVADANRIYQHLMNVAPDNAVVRNHMTQTGAIVPARAAAKPAAKSPASPSNGSPAPRPQAKPSAPPVSPELAKMPAPELKPAEAAARPVTAKPAKPAQTPIFAKPREAVSAADDPAATRKLIRNYENVLKLNPRNPAAQLKLAELLDRTGEKAEATAHWEQAARQFIEKGDLNNAILSCDRILKTFPENAVILEIRSQAMVQRDSLRAIDGAISHDL